MPAENIRETNWRIYGRKARDLCTRTHAVLYRRTAKRPADDHDDDYDHVRCCHNLSNISRNYRTFIWSIQRKRLNKSFKKRKIIFGIRNLFPCIPLLWRSMCNVHPKIDEKLQKVQSLHTSIASTRSYSFRKHDQYTSQTQIWLVRINHSQLTTDTSVHFGISVESNFVYTWYISRFDLLIAMQSLA